MHISHTDGKNRYKIKDKIAEYKEIMQIKFDMNKLMSNIGTYTYK